jgi:hypothetical protein
MPGLDLGHMIARPDRAAVVGKHQRRRCVPVTGGVQTANRDVLRPYGAGPPTVSKATHFTRNAVEQVLTIRPSGQTSAVPLKRTYFQRVNLRRCITL